MAFGLATIPTIPTQELSMKRFFCTIALVLALVPALPGRARADCLASAIKSCDADFPGGDPKTVSIRGWCYMIRWSWCNAFDV